MMDDLFYFLVLGSIVICLFLIIMLAIRIRNLQRDVYGDDED